MTSQHATWANPDVEIEAGEGRVYTSHTAAHLFKSIYPKSFDIFLHLATPFLTSRKFGLECSKDVSW